MTLLFWLFGALTAMAGTVIYIDFGLNIPRHIIDGKKEPVVRNGGDLNYVRDALAVLMIAFNQNAGNLPTQTPQVFYSVLLRCQLHFLSIQRCQCTVVW
jgi:hypothetical protein